MTAQTKNYNTLTISFYIDKIVTICFKRKDSQGCLKR